VLKLQQNNALMLGASGSGKSFLVAYWLAEEVLPYTNWTVYTNFPLGLIPSTHHVPPSDGEFFIDRLAAYVAGRHNGGDVSRRIDYASRIKVLPPDVLDAWANSESGPWEYEMEPASVLILDEIGVYAHRQSPMPHQVLWSKYLGLSRHEDRRNLLATQNGQKLSSYVSQECGERWLCSDRAGDVDPLTRASIGDIQQLIAKWQGKRVGHTQVIQEINPGGGRWERSEPVRVRRSPKYFEFYNSFSAPDTGKGKGSQRLEVWQELGWFRLVGWFCRRNTEAVFRVGLGVVLLALFVLAVFNVELIVKSGTDWIAGAFRPDESAAVSVPSVVVKEVDAMAVPRVRGRIGSAVVLDGGEK